MDIQRFLKFYKVGWKTYRDPLMEASHSSIYYWREQMKYEKSI